MFNDARGFKKIYLAAGYTDLRRGIDGLASIIRYQFQLDPHDKNTLFFSVGGAVTGSRPCSGKAMASCSCTRGWTAGLSAGRVLQMRQWKFRKTSTRC